MRILTAKKTKKTLRGIWPDIERVPTDRQFYVADLDFLLEQLAIVRVGLPDHKANKFACEEFAFGSWFLLHQHRVIMDEEDRDYNIHYGVLWGTSFKNALGSHYNNFAITEQGLYIIDFESSQHWKPTNNDIARWGFE